MTAFRLASTGDDEQLRRLLRENGMPGWVEMSMQREPSYFAGVDRFGRDWAVLAEDGGELVGMYAASVLPLCVNGAVERVGYLGGLRIQPAHRRRIRHLREGFASIHQLAPEATTVPWWFTLIAEDNDVARRLLESGVRGLPRYRAIGSYATYAVAAARGQPRALWRRLRPGELPSLLAWHRQLAARQQLTPVLDEQHLRRIGTDGLWMCGDGDGFVGMAVLWNQGAFKQVVVRRYRGALRWLRPAYNGYARLARRVALPAQGAALGQTFVAFLTLAPQVVADRSTMRALLADLLSKCSTPVAALGLHDEHPLLPALAGFKPMRYAARVYAVEFGEPARLDGRPVQPEAALL
jgi:hypothetical protein